MKKLITVFTPTYNRSELLSELYISLKEQTSKNFKWVIVDDGSSDDTQSMVDEWMNENSIEIEYYYQNNSGKMAAHNRAVQLCDTELFVDIDSDDCAYPSCVETIENYGKYILNECDLSALVFPYFLETTESSGFGFSGVTNFKGLNLNGYKGETTLVFKTSILKKYLFPKISGEKFIPEGYIYMQIDEKYKMISFDEHIVYGKYRNDGYTQNSLRLNKENPNGFALLNRQKYMYNGDIENLIRCISYHMLGNKKKILEDIKLFPISIVYLPLAFGLTVKRCIQYKKAGL